MTNLKLMGLAVLFLLNQNANAQISAQPVPSQLEVEIQGLLASLQGRNQVVEALYRKDFSSVAQQSMEYAIRELANDLQARDDASMAEELLSQWEVASAQFHQQNFGILSNKDLGDHPAQFVWLEDFLQKMATKYGEIIFTLPFVQDIRTINFAIPVVFAPKGAWRVNAGLNNQEDKIEYRKHFIPFSNIVTYYASYYGCVYVVQKQGMDNLKKLCKQAAEKLKFVMGRYIAPKISDWVFNASHQVVRPRMSTQSRQMVYRTPEQLRNDILKGAY